MTQRRPKRSAAWLPKVLRQACHAASNDPDSVSYLLDCTDQPKLQANQGTALAQNEACLSSVERGTNDVAPLPGLRRK